MSLLDVKNLIVIQYSLSFKPISRISLEDEFVFIYV